MFIRKKYSKNTTKTAVQICQNTRIGSKVQQKVLRHVGFANSEEELVKLIELAEYIKYTMETAENKPIFDDEYMLDTIIKARRKAMEEEQNQEELVNIKNLREESRVITGIHEIYGRIYDEIGFNKLFSNRQQGSQRKLFHTVMARISDPLSKRASVEKLAIDYGVNMKLQSIYEMMDNIDDDKISKVKDIASSAAQSLLKTKIDILFYDCTTLYFESFVEDGFKEFGYSKDHKFNQGQVLLSLLVSQEGLPIGYEVYPGSKYEGHTVIDAIASIEKRYDVNRVVFVADSGMVNEKNRRELEARGIRYILGARMKNMPDKIKKEILTIEKAQDTELSTKEVTLSNKSRLIVSYRPERARKDKHDRDKWLEKLEKKLHRIMFSC